MQGKKILVIPDTQAKDGVDLSYMSWIGQYIVDKRPDIIVHLGDAFDFPSLSSYDKGKLSFEGRRLQKDIETGKKSLKMLLDPMKKLNNQQRRFKKPLYKPRMIFCTGNHEQRLMRIPDEMPEFAGFIGYDLLGLEEMGWEVYDFLQPVDVEGIFFVHYLANPFTGRPYGGSAMNQLKIASNSYVVGHKQTLDVAIRPTLAGNLQLGIIAGAAYPFEEAYKGYQGNTHWRGVILLHDVHDGYGDPCFVSLKFLKEKFGENK